MANLFPRSTDLPLTVWVGPNGGARYDARIKVSASAGNRMDLDGAAVVAVRPTPAVIEGQLSREEEQAIFRWVLINEAALIDHWNGLTDGSELVSSLRKLQP